MRSSYLRIVCEIHINCGKSNKTKATGNCRCPDPARTEHLFLYVDVFVVSVYFGFVITKFVFPFSSFGPFCLFCPFTFAPIYCLFYLSICKNFQQQTIRSVRRTHRALRCKWQNASEQKAGRKKLVQYKRFSESESSLDLENHTNRLNDCMLYKHTKTIRYDAQPHTQINKWNSQTSHLERSKISFTLFRSCS